MASYSASSENLPIKPSPRYKIQDSFSTVKSEIEHASPAQVPRSCPLQCRLNFVRNTTFDNVADAVSIAC